MNAFPITARNLAQRLGTVARDLELEPEEIELFASIAGVRIPLQSTTFQVDDDGTLLFLNGFESFLAELQTQVKEANENLQSECRRNTALALRLHNLVNVTNRLGSDLASICEAYLAGDEATVLAGVGKFAAAYQRNLKPAEGRVH